MAALYKKKERSPVTVLLDEDIKLKAQNYAKEYDLPLSEILRTLITTWLNDEDKINK